MAGAGQPKVLAWLDTIDEDRSFISVASTAATAAWHRADGGGPALCCACQLVGG